MEEQQTKKIPEVMSRREFLRRMIKAASIVAVPSVLPGISCLLEPVSAAAAGGGQGDENSKEMERRMKERDERIKRQIEEPSQYEAHVLRNVDNRPEISLERVHLVGIAFWPKGESPQIDGTKEPIEEVFAEISRFWEKALDNKTAIRSEFLPLTIMGNKYGDEYSSDEIREEIEEAIKEQVEDQDMVSRFLARFETSRTGNYEPSGDEFFCPVVFVMSHPPTAEEPLRTYRYPASANLGLVTIPIGMEALLNWGENRADNLVAHEVGHGLSFPDQYKFDEKTGSLPNQWYDADPKNIMGANMFDSPLSEMHLADSVKKWILNKADST